MLNNLPLEYSSIEISNIAIVAVARFAEILIITITTAEKPRINQIYYHRNNITIEIFFRWNHKLAIVAVGRFAETLILRKLHVGRKDETFW